MKNSLCRKKKMFFKPNWYLALSRALVFDYGKMTNSLIIYNEIYIFFQFKLLKFNFQFIFDINN